MSTPDVRKRKWDEPAEGASKAVKTEGSGSPADEVKPAVTEEKSALDAAGQSAHPVDCLCTGHCEGRGGSSLGGASARREGTRTGAGTCAHGFNRTPGALRRTHLSGLSLAPALRLTRRTLPACS